MSRLKVPVMRASSVECLEIRIFQSVVLDYYRELYKDRLDESLGDLSHGHSTRALQVPALWSAYAESCHEPLVSFSTRGVVHHTTAYVDGIIEMGGLFWWVLRAWFSTSISG